MAPFTVTLRIILPVTLMLLLGILRREKIDRKGGDALCKHLIFLHFG